MMPKIKIALTAPNIDYMQRYMNPIVKDSIGRLLKSTQYDFLQSPYCHYGIYIDQNRNALVNDNKTDAVKQTIESEWTHILFIDIDIVANIDNVKVLVDEDKPIIASLYKSRAGGYSGGHITQLGATGIDRYNGSLIELTWVATGFLLIRKDVFNNIYNRSRICGLSC